jgi:hypothetical protein
VLNDRGFFGPAQFPHFPVYLVVGILLLALVVGWYVFVVRFSRGRFPRPVVDAAVKRPDLPALRAKYLSMIDEVESEQSSGRLTERAVASRLSLLLRFFVFESSGVDAQVMTLTDLRRAALPGVTGAVEQYYPPAVRGDHPGDPAAAVATAREVVLSWS